MCSLHGSEVNESDKSLIALSIGIKFLVIRKNELFFQFALCGVLLSLSKTVGANKPAYVAAGVILTSVFDAILKSG